MIMADKDFGRVRMRVWSDQPEVFPWLGPPREAPGPADPAGEALWRRLAEAAQPHAHAWGGETSFWREGYAVAVAAESQYDALRDLAATGALPPGHRFCLAARGSGFHGREGRRWETMAGNLHLSAVLTVDLPAAAWGPVLPALPALAALDVVGRFAAPGRTTGIKWINDVLVDGAKIAGVLTAVRTRDARIANIFLGLGLNVAAAPALPPDSVPADATHLGSAAGRAVGLDDVLSALLRALARRFTAAVAAGPASLVADYRAASLVVGRRVLVLPETGADAGTPVPVSGRVVGIGPDLSLQLADAPPVRGGRLLRSED